jgi:ATPase complex subunit ATP10
MNPNSISKTILPGNFVKKMSMRNGSIKKRYTELVHGYFWMLKDLQRSNEKPILSNQEIISESVAKVFPTLTQLRKLDSNELVNLPSFFLRRNRSLDVSAQCTVVGISYRDYGFQTLKSWMDPLQVSLNDKQLSDRIEVVRLSISEGWISRWVLSGLIVALTKKNTPHEEQKQTLLYFGSDDELEPFRDALRMHNLMTCYVFLLDGLGRVRFAGSGPASQEDVERLQQFASALTRQRALPIQSRTGKQAAGR